ncbi:MAG: TolC family protein [Woeseiaceae bacterium]
MKSLYAILLVLSLASCAAGPDYVAPETAAPEFVRAAEAQVTERPFEAAWWEQFGDPVLSQLVDRALSGDLDLQAAAARVEEARALAGESRRALWPEVSAGAAAGKSKAQQPGFSSQRLEVQEYRTGLETKWELDLFGRARRNAEAAAADAEAAEADLHAVQVLVASEVATTYLELRGAQKRLAVARDNLASQQKTLDLIRVKLELGRGTELDVASARAQYSAIEAGIPPLAAAEEIAGHRLAVLTGQRPGALDDLLEPREIAPQVTTLNVGSADTLLARRPDVRAAERHLAASSARVGAATADFFPRLSLSGFIGFIAGDAGALGETASRAWNAGSTLSWSAINGERSRLSAAEARAHGARAAYEKTVLLALEEAEDAFARYGHNRQRLTAAVDRVDASRKAASLARIQYREGALDYLRLLDAERTVLDAEDALATAETELNTSVVQIYKALGGGWEAAPDEVG